ncbi:MAG: hypothetical protein Q8P17_01960 [bacterium]|nr:hypothetical protein [bacterium]
MKSDVCDKCRLNPVTVALQEIHEVAQEVAEVFIAVLIFPQYQESLVSSDAKRYVHFAVPAFRGSLAFDATERKVFGGRKAFA